MRRSRTTATIVLLAGLSAAAGDPSDALRSRLQGTWRAESWGVSITVVGDRLFFTAGDPGDGADATRLTVDAARSPATFDTRGAASGEPKMTGILDVAGDRLRLAVANDAGGPRPTSFDPDATKAVITFTRVPPPATRPTTRPADAVWASLQGTWQAESILDGRSHDPAAGVSATVVGDRMFLAEHDSATASVLTIDATRSPATYDARGAVTGDRQPAGILDVTGDRLRFAFRKAGDRPTSFDPDATKIIMTFRRPPTAASTQPAPHRTSP